MKKSFPIFSLLIIFTLTVFANKINDSSYTETPVTLHTKGGDIFGTLTILQNKSITPVALIIAGSGPTDRNGNNPTMKNDGLKQLAQGLANAGIASLRFDKRGIAASSAAGKNEADLRFEDYINDAIAWIEFLRKDIRFNSITVIGHSEGSLIGMIAGRNADKFISIAGAGQSADIIIKDQLSSQPQKIRDISFPILDSLKAGKTVANVDPMLNALFRPSIQPYLISWFKYDPQLEIHKLNMPILILQGTNDLQVKVDDANRLSHAKQKAKLVLIENMNHVLKIVTGKRDENIKAYNDPSLPVSEELIRNIIAFMKVD